LEPIEPTLFPVAFPSPVNHNRSRRISCRATPEPGPGRSACHRQPGGRDRLPPWKACAACCSAAGW
jgi:hypothetical protein